MKNKELTPGTTVWVVERNEEGCACDVSGYVFLAVVLGWVIASPSINGSNSPVTILWDKAIETAERGNTDLCVFSSANCFEKKDDAQKILEESERE